MLFTGVWKAQDNQQEEYLLKLEKMLREAKEWKVLLEELS